ncbi:hypothetical protein [Rhizobium oryzicola]|uniref:Uncharacterized protein n=1 Tax=Rhizobium oryzicola TaxID=1232668 RepID=A0ABT8T8A4_9HYPH|nr:hypothetical protein [Rhizobium oryzicola]MDO1585442.1 hypothetical protein [Rhizobium oryzicola]
MGFNFAKIHANGDDFVIVDLRCQAVDIDRAVVAGMGDWNQVIGINQLAVVERPPLFPHLTNVHSVRLVSRSKIRLRIGSAVATFRLDLAPAHVERSSTVFGTAFWISMLRSKAMANLSSLSGCRVDKFSCPAL